MAVFKLPDVGEGISEAELIEWRVAVGDEVDEDQIVAFIGTDKVNVELPSPRAGRVAELCWAEGDIVPVGEVLIRFTDPADAAPVAIREQPAPAAAAPATAAPEAPSPVAAPPGGSPVTVPVVAAPSTRRYAAELGVELVGVVGTGPGGRILREDVDAVAGASAAPPPPSRPVQPPSTSREGPASELEPLRGVRSVASRRMAAAAQQTAASTTTFEVDADGVRTLLEQVRACPGGDQVKLTPLAVMAKCVAAALLHHPRFNATITEDGTGLHLHRDVHLGVAVASTEGLTVPVVREANRLTLLELAAAIQDVAARARSGSLEVAELQGGSFTVSSTGGLEQARIVSTTPLINLPQTAIVWFSRIEDRPRVRDGALEVGPMLTASVTFDHRFIDGAEITAFVNTLAALLERPVGALA